MNKTPAPSFASRLRRLLHPRVLLRVLWKPLLLTLLWTVLLKYSPVGAEIRKEFRAFNGGYYYEDAQERRARLRERHPNNLAVEINVIEGHAPWESSGYTEPFDGFDSGRAFSEQENAYEKLIVRYPGNPVPIARRLVALETAEQTLGAQIGNSSARSRRLRMARRRRALAVARAGQRLEPDNCFYDWVIIRQLYDDARYREAAAIIRAAARKPRFDDHDADVVRAIIAARQLEQPLSYDEKVRVRATVTERTASPFGQIAGQIAAQASRLAAAGDHDAALRLAGDAARLCGPATRGPNNFATGLRSIEMRGALWGANPVAKSSLATKRRKQSKQHYAVTMAGDFADYATAHGRSDLAREARAAALDITRYQARRAAFPGSRNGVEFITPTLTKPVFAHRILDWLAFMQAPGIVFLLFGLGFVLLLTSRVQPTRRDLALSLVPMFATYAAMSIAILPLSKAAMYAPPSARTIMIYMVAGMLTYVLLPAVLGALVCGITTAWRIERAARAAPAPDRPPLLPDRRPAVRAFFAWCPIVITLLCFAGLGAALYWTGKWTLPFKDWDGAPITLDEPDGVFGVCGVLGVGFSYLMWLIRWRWFAATETRPQQIYGLRWYQSTLRLWLIIASLWFVLLAALSLPLRRAADAAFDLSLRDGEIGTMQRYANAKNN